MEPVIQQIRKALLMSLLTLASVTQAQTTEPGDPVANERSFDVGMYLGKQWKLNLRLATHRPARIMITLKDPHNGVLYRELLKKRKIKYWREFNFNGAAAGAYQFEISDGRNTIVRRVDVVDLPAVASQRYITYNP